MRFECDKKGLILLPLGHVVGSTSLQYRDVYTSSLSAFESLNELSFYELSIKREINVQLSSSFLENDLTQNHI